MGMGRRKHRQDTLWVATAELPRTAGHVFYERVNRILNEREFRPVRRGCVREVLRRSDGSAEPGTGQVFSDVAGGLL